ncbi:MAG TPA: transglutaminase domain-containing protein, partial [Rhodanobacteraceae bacterium]|nr:transglutaminase domain-containing protein [Rhodanobacteraceae bacterium]
MATSLPALSVAAGIPPTISGDSSLDAITGLVTAGQFQAADARIEAALKQPGLSPDMRTALEFQRVRMQRMRDDFSLTADEVEAKVRKQIPDMTDAEFADWDAHGLFEHITIDGERMYFKRSPSNLFHLSAAARARRQGESSFVGSGLPKQVNDNYIDYDRDVIRE